MLQTDKPFNGLKVTKIFLFFSLIFILIGGVSAVNLTDGVVSSYSMENFPSNLVWSYDGVNNITLYESDYTNQVTNVYAHNGLWGLKISDPSLYANKTGITEHSFDPTVTAYKQSESFWVKPLEGNGSYILYSYGYSAGAHTVVSLNNNNDVYIGYVGAFSGAGCTNEKQTKVTTNADIVYDDWNHIVITHDWISDENMQTYVYVNGVNQTISSGVVTGSESPSGSNTFALGKVLPSIHTNCPYNQTNLTSAVDQFMIYNRTIDSDEISALYNAGVGIDPYDPTPADQIASLPSTSLNFDTYLTRDFGVYYNYEDYVEIHYEYNSLDTTASFSGPTPIVYTTATNGVFALEFISATEVTFYSFNIPLISNDINATMRACNSYGCTSWVDIYFSIGYDAGGVIQIASIGPVSMGLNESVYRTYSDYFLGYTTRYMQYPDPTTFVLTNITSSSSDSNICFNASIIDDNAIFTSKSLACTVNNVYFIVDDGSNVVVSNPFSITVSSNQAPNGTATGKVVNSFDGLFPDYDSIPFKTRMVYVLLTMGITALIGVFFLWNSEGYGGLITMGVSALLLVEFMFFTAIKYIPILWIAIFAVAVAVLGIGLFTRNTVGDGG